jgi:hypothetical protein
VIEEFPGVQKYVVLKPLLFAKIFQHEFDFRSRALKMREFHVCHNWSTDFICSELGLISSLMNIVSNKETAYVGILCLP